MPSRSGENAFSDAAAIVRAVRKRDNPAFEDADPWFELADRCRELQRELEPFLPEDFLRRVTSRRNSEGR